MALAERIARRVPTDWQGGAVFHGVVTEQSLAVLERTQAGEQCSPFFALCIDGDLHCEHWGSEIHILKSTLQDAKLRALIDELGDRASIAAFSS